MRFVFRVEIEADRDTGKFASRDELTEQLKDVLETADCGTLEGGEGGQYSTTSWEVSEIDEKAEAKERRILAKVAKFAERSKGGGRATTPVPN